VELLAEAFPLLLTPPAVLLVVRLALMIAPLGILPVVVGQLAVAPGQVVGVVIVMALLALVAASVLDLGAGIVLVPR
jgi:hypothetical protein